MSVKINSLELENVKRIKAVRMEPSENGLTIIGGNNNQGKTSVLDAIAWALGGNKFKPSKPEREGSVIPPNLKVVLNNGLIVERKGKNSALKVTDPQGNKSGQQILDKLIGEMALNVPKFMNSGSKEKAEYLLQIIGIGPQLKELELKEAQIYNERRAIGQIADQKAKFAKEQMSYEGVPDDLVSASELIKQQQDILARNGENERKRQNAAVIKSQFENSNVEVTRLRSMLDEAITKNERLREDLEVAQKDILTLHDESTEELEQNIKDIEEINRKIRANLDKEKAEEDARNEASKYKEFTDKLEAVRKTKQDLLERAELPLPGLYVQEGEIVYNGQKWDNMSGSEQLKVATAIVRKLNPECGFVLLDKLEQMDMITLKEFGEWLEQEGLQAIATKVSVGKECSVLIEDGYVKDAPKEEYKAPEEVKEEVPTWTW